MAQKFGKGRWVKEGFLDNRQRGSVVGRITFAAIGAVDFYLVGDFKGEIAGTVIRFVNSDYSDDDIAAHVLADMEVPQVGEVSLISFDPHPHLSPHPYIEWFSERKNHYRIELKPQDAAIASIEEARQYDNAVSSIRTALASRAQFTRDGSDADWV